MRRPVEATLIDGAATRQVGEHRLKLDETEQVFTKLKHLLRKTAERPLEATWKHIGVLFIGVLFNCFLPRECQAYLENAEYGST